MVHSFSCISLMLIGVLLCLSGLVSTQLHNHRHPGHWRLAGRDPPTPTTTISPVAAAASPCNGADCVAALPVATNIPCEAVHGYAIANGFEDPTLWRILCDVDFYKQDIFPFYKAQSFAECLGHCQEYRRQNGEEACAGIVFAPDRLGLENDCYLKSSVYNVVYPATIHVVAATAIPTSLNMTAVVTLPIVQPTAPSGKGPLIAAAAQAPKISKAYFLGTSVNKHTEQYVKHAPALPVKLATNLLKPGVNLDLINNYPLAKDTGSWNADSMTVRAELGKLSIIPRLSRDGGRGGTINGTSVFLFCDTATFGEVETAMGYMNGFVSSSAAIGKRQDTTTNDSLTLENPIGQWQDDVGRLRGLVEMTTGEEAFNIAVSGDGFRYAVWPESGLIPLNATYSLVYATLVYVQVDMSTQNAVFTSLGNSLITVSVDPIYGPFANRLVNQMFTEDEVEWGSIGGLRAWGPSGIGTMDGMIYLFGKVDRGVLVAKVPPESITDRSAYVYWDGSEWSSKMQYPNSTAYLIEQPVMDFDIFYSPYHKYFIMVYLTPFADNTFWYRWTHTLINQVALPPYESGGREDYCERIVHSEWSEPIVLYKPDIPASGYIYAGGVHLGYYGAEDINNGGNYLLLTWTEHTEKDPNDPSSGYAHKSARVGLFYDIP